MNIKFQVVQIYNGGETKIKDEFKTYEEAEASIMNIEWDKFMGEVDFHIRKIYTSRGS